MAIHTSRFVARAQVAALGMVLGLLFAATARGESDEERKAPYLRGSMVPLSEIRLEGSGGSGCVIDIDDKGSATIVTNYHVVEGEEDVDILPCRPGRHEEAI